MPIIDNDIFNKRLKLQNRKKLIMTESKKIMKSNNIFVIVDTYDVNLNGNLETNIIGVFTDIDTARQCIENLNLENFRWVSDTRFKFSTYVAHIGEIKQMPSNVIWTIQIGAKMHYSLLVIADGTKTLEEIMRPFEYDLAFIF